MYATLIMVPATAVPVEPGNVGYSKTSRRQYQSCDQCRKSRRACDAAALGVVGYPQADDLKHEHDGPYEACSNCSRRNKKCTFDWLRRLSKQALPKGVKRKLELTGFGDAHYSLPLGRAEDTKKVDDFSESPTNAIARDPSLPRSLEEDISANEPSSRIAAKGTPFRSDDTEPCQQQQESGLGAALNDQNIIADDACSLTLSPGPADPLQPPRTLLVPLNADVVGNEESLGDQQWKVDPSLSRSSRHPLQSGRGYSSLLTRYLHSMNAGLSPLQHRVTELANKSMIAEGLLQIYHSSFELSLSCWVTERNCPYERELASLHRGIESPIGDQGTLRSPGENRLISRVCRLDAAFAPLRRRPLSASESRAASRALNAAIMAFASQWSHTSHGQTRPNAGEEINPSIQSSGLDDNVPEQSSYPGPSDSPSNDFERSVQMSLWHDARKSLQSCVEVDSFKVIFAYMLFALTQKPFEGSVDDNASDSVSPHPPSASVNNQQPGWSAQTEATSPSWSRNESGAQALDELEALGPPPIYLETAVRNLFSWRRRLGRHLKMSSTKTINISLKDRQSFNMLFWLGVMCDTTVSAISERPLVIADEDCAIISEDPDPSYHPVETDVSYDKPYGSRMHPHFDGNIWGLYLLGLKFGDRKGTEARWPCSLADAASVLREAIPTKVLLFRKVAQLKTLSYRSSSPRDFESCIKEALDVYQHWNAHYGQFMLDCIADHNHLPPQVQSWYVILGSHWHLGCLLLAAMIEQLDAETKTLNLQRSLRRSCALIWELQKENAYAISNLSEVGCAEMAAPFQETADLHFAVNDGALLTEPWTDVLNRALSTASHIFLEWMSCWYDATEPRHLWVLENTNPRDLRNRCEFCINALSMLGRKSDMANLAAKSISARLRSHSELYRSAMLPQFSEGAVRPAVY